MNALTMSDLVDPRIIPSLKSFGKYEWMRWRSGDEGTMIDLQFPLVPELIKHMPFIEGLKKFGEGEPVLLLKLFGLSKLLANGPKIARPTIDQCVALSHVDVKVSFERYEQPFPAFLLEVPEAYRQELSGRFTQPCPRFVCVFHDRRTGYLVLSTDIGPEMAGSTTVLSPCSHLKTIEDALFIGEHDENLDVRLEIRLYRIALNFGLLLTRFGATDCGPIDPVGHARLRQLAQKKKGKKPEKARRKLAAVINLIELDQKVVFHEVSTITAGSSGEGSTRKPHWRRGHFRHQRCGVGRMERRLTFVRPCFINAESFRGDLADTTYAIHAPNGTSPEASCAGDN